MNDNISNKNKKTNNVERIISRCNSCRTLIREGEFAYIFDQGKKIEKPSWVKCEECYNQFQPEAEKYNSSVSSLWTWGSIVNFVLSIVAGFIAIYMFQPGDNIFKTLSFAFGFIVFFVICSLIIWIIRLIWRPYSILEKLVYSVKEEEKEEVKEENPQV